MVRVLEDSIETIVPKYNPRVIPTSQHQTHQHEHFLQLSDVHAGEVVEEEAVNGLNKYNWNVMEDHHDELLRGVCSFKENRPYPIRNIHIGILGDMVSGIIHEELTNTNEFPIIKASYKYGLTLAAFIEKLAQIYEEVFVDAVVGNHGRLYPKPQAKEKYNNFDYLTYQVARLRLAQYKNIHWTIPESSKHPIIICKRRIVLWHGDGPRTTMIGVPWGGIIRLCNNITNEWARAKMPIDYFATGHWHEPNVVRNILINGSMIGPNEWSLDRFGYGTEPTQLLHTFHPVHGLAETCYIDLKGEK